MRLTTSHKIYASVLGVALVAFALDRAFLAPGGAEAGETTPDAAGDTDTVQMLPPVKLIPVAAPTTRTLALSFRELAERRGLKLEDMSDPFTVPPHWLPDQATVRIGTSTDVSPGRRFLAAHQLNAVLANEQGGAAIIDGKRFRIGQELDGFRLVLIQRRSVVLEGEGVRVMLSLPTPSGGGS